MSMRSGVLLFAEATLLLLLAPIAALGQYYLPGEPASGGGIWHYTRLTPPEATRTEIGMAEIVDLGIYSWYDQDIWVDEWGLESPVEDYIGLVEWTHFGSGRLEVYGDSAVFYAPRACNEVAASISVAVYDSGMRGIDPANIDSVTFSIFPPEYGAYGVFYYDEWLAPYGPPVNSMGAQSAFAFQTRPYYVNFHNLPFREHVERQEFTWPDGTNYTRTEIVWPYWVDVDGSLSPNWAGDIVSTAGQGGNVLWKVDHLYDGQSYQPIVFPVVQQLQFWSDDGGWVTYATPMHPRNYVGWPTFEAQVGWFCTTGDWGGLQGPYSQLGN